MRRSCSSSVNLLCMVFSITLLVGSLLSCPVFLMSIVLDVCQLLGK